MITGSGTIGGAGGGVEYGVARRGIANSAAGLAWLSRGRYQVQHQALLYDSGGDTTAGRFVPATRRNNRNTTNSGIVYSVLSSH